MTVVTILLEKLVVRGGSVRIDDFSMGLCFPNNTKIKNVPSFMNRPNSLPVVKFFPETQDKIAWLLFFSKD